MAKKKTTTTKKAKTGTNGKKKITRIRLNGGAQFPPGSAGRKTKRLSDGFHRREVLMKAEEEEDPRDRFVAQHAIDLEGIFEIEKDPVVGKLLVAALERDEGLPKSEIRRAVATFYGSQKERIRQGNRVFSAKKHGEPIFVSEFFFKRQTTIEADIKKLLVAYCKFDPMASFARSVQGIGPVIAGGLSAFIDFDLTKSVSALWRFAGLDPTAPWSRPDATGPAKKKRCFCAALKQVAYKAGRSWVYLYTRPEIKSYYAQIYIKWKQTYFARNESGQMAEEAARRLAEKKVNYGPASLAAYKKGKLPARAIEYRACRKAVKRFLAHYWEYGYELFNGQPPRNPWVIEHGGHNPESVETWRDMVRFERGDDAPELASSWFKDLRKQLGLKLGGL